MILENEFYEFAEEEARIATAHDPDDLYQFQMASLLDEPRMVTRLQDLLKSLDRY